MKFSRYSSRLKTPGAFSGTTSRRPGNAPMAAPPDTVSQFISIYVPMEWAAQVQMFGSTADYWLMDGDSGQAVTLVLIWKDGALDEETTYGRYTHALIYNSDLPRMPRKRDVIVRNGLQYNVVQVDAYIYGVSTVVLQEGDPVALPIASDDDGQVPWDETGAPQ